MLYDAILLVSFGGPEKREDVIPFLENVTRGRNVPRARLEDVAEHYYRIGGKSPINHQNRALCSALERELAERGPRLPVYWGNRNWHPLLSETVAEMKAGGIRSALAFVTSAYSSYSGCRQYVEDIARAREQAGAGAPRVEKLPVFYNRPGFIHANAERIRAALAKIPAREVQTARLVYTAHSIPVAMAQNCRYVEQLRYTCRMVSRALGRTSDDPLVFQSRSGRPVQPWLEPDLLDHLREIAAAPGSRHVVIAPIGFISDHVEVVYDLDIEARALCDRLDLCMVRAGTVGVHPAFVRMVREMILEAIRREIAPHNVIGPEGERTELCGSDCCLPGGA